MSIDSSTNRSTVTESCLWEDINAKISDKTVTLVSHENGFRINVLPDLARAAHDAGSLLSVDATQAIGRMTAEVSAVDFLVAPATSGFSGFMDWE